MITKENCSIETLSHILESAFIEHSLKNDCIMVTIGGTLTLLEIKSNFISMCAVYNSKPELSEQSLLKSLNDINSKYLFPTVYLHAGAIIFAQFAILLGAGIPERSLVEALRHMGDLLLKVPELDAITR